MVGAKRLDFEVCVDACLFFEGGREDGGEEVFGLGAAKIGVGEFFGRSGVGMRLRVQHFAAFGKSFQVLGRGWSGHRRRFEVGSLLLGSEGNAAEHHEKQQGRCAKGHGHLTPTAVAAAD
jgi:hypothetical protein